MYDVGRRQLVIMKRKKEEKIVARLDGVEKTEIEALSEALDITVSQIIRDSVREHLPKLRSRAKKRETILQN
jgi:hypothetical protein